MTNQFFAENPLRMQVLFYGIGGYGENEAIARSCWPHHDLIVVLAGTVHFTLGDMRLSCGAGHALHIAPRTPFFGLSGTSGCRLWVQHFALSAEDCEQLPAFRNAVARGRGLICAICEWSKRVVCCARLVSQSKSSVSAWATRIRWPFIAPFGKPMELLPANGAMVRLE